MCALCGEDLRPASIAWEADDWVGWAEKGGKEHLALRPFGKRSDQDERRIASGSVFFFMV